MKETLLKEYDDSKTVLADFRDKMSLLISELLKNELVQVHQVIGRLKERTSLEKKIDKKQDKYTSLHEITDVVGLRIITYLESDVDVIAEVVRKEFNIDLNNSIDKRELRADQFGYRSLHFVASCLSERTRLGEYQRFDGIKFEIQIRSILQHAWAEIEHDLGYKGITSIPDAYKRNFNRVAALLESADLEFDRLKKDLIKYESEVADLIENEPETVTIDQASLMSFIHSNKIIQKALKIISQNVGCTFKPYLDYYQDTIVRFIGFFHINTIEDLNNLLKRNEKLYLEFTNELTKSFSREVLSESIVLVYLQHFLAALEEDQNLVIRYINFNSDLIGAPEGMYIECIRRAKATLSKLD